VTVTAQQRREIFQRAGKCCEYCRFGGGRQPLSFHVDHVIALKHGGSDDHDNLCLACAPCNQHKGAEVAAIDPLTSEATKLFNPRQQKWDEHFQINSDASLSGITAEGRATVLVLRMNEEERVEQRHGETLLGNYPCQTNS